MSRFSGPQGRGAMHKVRQQKRIEAEIRNEEYQARKRAEAKEDGVDVSA